MTISNVVRPRLPRRSQVARSLLLVAALVASAWFWPVNAFRTATFIVDNMITMAPIIVLAVLLPAAISATGSGAHLQRIFEGRTAAIIFWASAVGAVTPICGVGVVPLVASLLSSGVPLAPVMAFWLSSPITDPAMFMVTAATLGLDFAVGKTLIAMAAGLAGGALTHLAVQRGHFGTAMRSGAASASACDTDCTPGGVSGRRDRRRMFMAEARRSTVLIVKWLAIAFALESIMRAHLPPDLITSAVGQGSVWAIPLTILIGIPMYLDGYAALPLIRGLIDLGMSPGAAMAFLVAGGITSLYASIAVFALVRLPVFLWYLALAVLSSALGGYLYDFYALAASAAA